MTQILIDYYLGAYGPTVRIDLRSRDALLTLREIWETLSRGALGEVELCESGDIVKSGIVSFVMRIVPPKQRLRKRLTVVPQAGGKVRLQWVNSREEWDHILALTEGLLDADTPGHQYLTEEGIDDALIELAYKEGSV